MRLSRIGPTLQQIVDAINGKLSFEDNLFVSVVNIADTGGANSDNTVNHGLQYIPTGYIWNIDRAGIVYDFNKAGWTNRQIHVKCSVANAVVRLIIF